MPSFAGVDFIDFDSQLNDEEKLVRQTARQFVDIEIIPIIEKHNREATFPVQLVPLLGELGFFGANLHGYGCAGMSNVAYGLMTQELERGDSGLRSFVSVQGALVMYPIYSFGSDAQKDKWLPLLQQGKAIGCFGLTEPQFGSNPGGMLTRAVKKGNKYVLNGEKIVDHQWLNCRYRGDLGEMRRRKNSRLPGGKRHARIQGLGSSWEMVAARFGDGRSGDERLRNPRRKSAARSLRPARSAELPESGALRNWLGRHWRGDGLLRHRTAICKDPQTICGQADCQSPARAGKTRVDDH